MIEWSQPCHCGDVPIPHYHSDGVCPFGERGGVDGRFLWVFAWCACGWNRSRWLPRAGRNALAAHQAGKVVR